MNFRELRLKVFCFHTQRCVYKIIGNLHADIMRNATRADIAIVNAGDLRWDAIKPAGVFRVEVSIVCLN